MADLHIEEISRDSFMYEKLGLRCGLEIHYQLDTEKKLFCNCPVGLRNDPHDAEIVRHMRPTLSELGEYDRTALMEFKTRKEVHYQLHYETVCTYEMDDTPPFGVNREALEIALEIALLLNCQIADEIHVSRKQYLDGSIPTGFQRTMAIGINGWFNFRGKRIRIIQVCLEEDACREVLDRGHVIIFRTDRLSTPLVEVITAPDMKTPEEAMEVDREIGRLLRATGRVRRGIGSVRQDVNVSIEGGTRVEIKGVPRTGMIGPVVHYEAMRQYSVLLLKEKIESRGIDDNNLNISSGFVTDAFRDTEVWTLKGAIERGGVVGAVRICGFRGFLGFRISPDRCFADEIGGRVRVIACLDESPIIYHSDGKGRNEKTPDKKKLGECNQNEKTTNRRALWREEKTEKIKTAPSDEEWKKVMDIMKAEDDDAIIILWGNREDVITGMKEVEIRVREALYGVIPETRQVIRGGQTDFERILPGPDRMYPDTDSIPIPIGKEMIENLRKRLPKIPEYWRRRYKNILNPWLIDQLIDKGEVERFDRLFESIKRHPGLIATTLTATLTALRRSGIDTGKISEEHLIEVFSLLGKGSIAGEMIPDVLREVAETGGEIMNVAKRYCQNVEDGIIEKFIDEAKNRWDESQGDGERKRRFVIGYVKRRLGNRVGGRRIAELVRKELCR